MPWKIEFSREAAKQFRNLDRSIQKRLGAALDRLSAELGDPELPSQSDVRKLVGKPDEWRLRVGDYRVRFEKQEQRLLITILRVAHRRDVYRD